MKQVHQTLNFNVFKRAFKVAGREDRFSERGLKMLYDWLDKFYSDDEHDLDVFDLCCQFSEFDKESFLMAYNINGVECIDNLEQALLDGTIDCVISYHPGENIILVNNDG